jgi:hypothetical protein
MSSGSEQQAVYQDRSLTNLLIGMAITIALVLGIPYSFGYFGWWLAPAAKGWIVLSAACLGILAKLLASETATGEFEFYKFGYDNCVMTLGAVITALAIQLSSPDDLFPGFSSLPKLGEQTAATNRIFQLIAFFVTTWLFTLLTARICGGIKRKTVNERGALALFSAIVGLLLLTSYSLLLAAKA